MRHKATQLFIWSVLMLLPLGAAAQTDSLYLDATVFTAPRPDAVAVPSAGGIKVELSRLKTLPSILGNADPLSYAHYLPSMSAQTELDAGIHIQGNDSQHNLVSAGGVPIYGASHLLGLFSVFNAAHYSQMDYRTWAREANRLGGAIDMTLPRELTGKTSGEFQLGLMAAQGSITAPVGSKAGVRLSARRSFMNLLYGKFLTMNGVAIKYGFTDLNLTGVWNPGSGDSITADFYLGGDNAKGGYGAFSMDADAVWKNAMGALHWKHSFGNSQLQQSVYYTSYHLDVNAFLNQTEARVPSYIKTAGYKARFTRGALSAGAESALHKVQPQSPSIIDGSIDFGDMSEPVQKGWESTMWGRYRLAAGPFSAEAQLKGSLFRSSEGQWMNGLDPDIVLGWNFYRAGQVALRLGTQHQYLFRTGMSDIGLPTEFWMLAGRYGDAQTASSAGLSYKLDFGAYTFAADAYYRLLGNQIEYRGSFMDIATGTYSLGKVLLHGNGRAYGVNLSLSKVSGAFTGWIAYAWGRSLRSFPEYSGECPASHERIHELDAVASWDLGRWTLGATLVAASGTPYTAPEYLYLMSQRAVCWWGPHNGSRLPAYVRADVSVNYWFRPQRSGLNFSIYNVTGSENQLFKRLSYNREESTFTYEGVSAGIRFMPSVSYFCKF